MENAIVLTQPAASVLETDPVTSEKAWQGESVSVPSLTTWDEPSLPAHLLPKSLAANSAASRFSLIRFHSEEQNSSLWPYEYDVDSGRLLCWLVDKSLSYCLTLSISLCTHSLQLQDLLYMNRVNVRQYTSIHPSHLRSSLCSAAPVE